MVPDEGLQSSVYDQVETETPLFDITALLASNSVLNAGEYKQFCLNIRKGARELEKFEIFLNDAIQQRNELASDPGYAMRVAQGFVILGKYQQAVEWVDKAGSAPAQCFLKANSLVKLGDYNDAVAQYEKAEAQGYDSFDVSVAIVAAHRRSGDLENAREKLKRVSRVGEIRSEYHYQLGRLLEADGQHGDAIDELKKAVELDENHVAAWFHYAYNQDLFGDEECAIEAYGKCISDGIVSVNALLNVAVLYEESGEYGKALTSITQVIEAFPNHERARMFLKDIQSSMVMYYDEDQERRKDRRNKVLEIPISDFELSVRSRNCLKKMNIRYLGDLLKVTEPELLAYKNFGETSLQEIKVILSSKGLVLGQLLEDKKKPVKQTATLSGTVQGDDEQLNKPIGALEFSLRARKCLERLNIRTVGELVSCTEAELLGCKNFGVTSLIEVRKCLDDQGLKLRSLDG